MAIAATGAARLGWLYGDDSMEPAYKLVMDDAHHAKRCAFLHSQNEPAPAGLSPNKSLKPCTGMTGALNLKMAIR
jgi:hypothetical protein